MPQMAPLWWTSLYMFFLSTYFIMNTSVYFSFLYKPISKKNNFLKEKTYWKW
uniref:ATP synthase complex subunit 8 n=1 Tax=Curculionoidea sp. 9 KM-2017 TaxID=2219422 RepID=A0A346RGY5_9CUCU|nr:ATP synthase F0 subunit 8 [Curculionoidea sp. 9 KM-2017]